MLQDWDTKIAIKDSDSPTSLTNDDDVADFSDAIVLGPQHTSATKPADSRGHFVSMDLTHLDTARYLGVLIFVNLFYMSLMILLTWIIVTVRSRQR